jgi:hypothetical protein
VFAVEKACSLTEQYGTPQCRQFREHIFRAHEFLSIPLARQYSRTAKNQGYPEANRVLNRFHQRLILGKAFDGLFIDSPDDDVKRFSEQRATEILRGFHGHTRRSGQQDGWRYVYRELKRADLEFPLKCLNREATENELIAALARCCDPRWWRRQIRRRQDHVLESICIEIGLVNKSRGIYASDHCIRRKREQWSRNESLLSELEAVNDLGEVFSLLDVAQRGISNLENRRNELMTRIDGFDKIALKQADIGLFITLTAPSKYHAFHAKPCRPNQNYQGATPRDTQDYLNTVWKRTRAALHRLDIRPYGFRVVEPHHDATPHWHLLLFVEPDQAKALIATLQHYALEEDGDERGAANQRLKIEEIDRSKGSAAAYIAKYISKNIDGHGLETDLYMRDATSSALRIRAWASNWGIRQFQQIGGPSVTVWRECRRRRDDEINAEISSEHLKEIFRAADDGNWEEFVGLSGGPTCERKHQPLRAFHVIKEQLNQFGEIVKQLKGVIYLSSETVKTRIRTWTIQSRPTNLDTCQGFISSGGANAPPLEFCQ